MNSNHIKYALWIFLLFFTITSLAVITQGNSSMLPFKKSPAYPFSSLSGILFFNGSPVNTAKIIRSYTLESDGSNNQDSTTTDQNGYFSFKSIIVDYKEPFLGAFEFLSHQSIIVEYKNNQYQIWGGGKFDKDEHAEFGGKIRNLRCEITEEIRRIEIGNGIFGTNCHWDTF